MLTPGAQDAEGKYEVLAKYARDLTEEARAGKLVRHKLAASTLEPNSSCVSPARTP
jgi:hypothetical protein